MVILYPHWSIVSLGLCLRTLSNQRRTMQTYHGGLSSISKWVLCLRGLSVCPSLSADVFPGFCWPFSMCIHSEVFIYVLNRALIFPYFIAGLLQAQNIEWEVHFLSLLVSQFFVRYRCRRKREWEFLTIFFHWTCSTVVLFFPVIRINYCCFPYAAWKRRKLKVSVSAGCKQNEKKKEDRIAFWGQRMLSE